MGRNANLTFQQTQWSRSDITLNEKGDTIFKNKDIAATFNEYLGITTESLDLHIWTERSNAFPGCIIDNSKDNNLMKWVNHPSIRTIEQKLNMTRKLLFPSVFVNNMKQVIKDLNSNKSVGGDIQSTLLRSTNISKDCEFTFSVLTDCINKSLKPGTFLDCLKEANITHFQKGWSSW